MRIAFAVFLLPAAAVAQGRNVPPPTGTRVAPPRPLPPTPAAPAGNAATEPPLPGEQEAVLECKKYPPNKRFKWELRGEVDLMALVNSIAPMMCRPIIVPGSIRQSKVTIIASGTVTAPEAYRMFLSALESMGLTVLPEGKVLKIIESNRARESAIPTYGGDNNPPTQDQFVTRLLRLEHVSPDEVKVVLDRLKSRDGDITGYGPTNTLVITDLATNIRRMEDVVKQLDVPMGGEKIWVIKLHTVSASDMASMLSSIFNVSKGGAPAAGARRPNLAPGAGAGPHAGRGPAGIGPVGVADHPRRPAEHPRRRLDGECLSAHPGAGQAARPDVGPRRRFRRPTWCTWCSSRTPTPRTSPARSAGSAPP